MESDAILDNLKRTCEANGVDCHVLGLSWGKFDCLESAHFDGIDFIIAADCLYETALFDSFLSTVGCILSRCGHRESSLLTVVHDRGSGRALAGRLRRWGLACEDLALDGLYGLPHLAVSSGLHTVPGADLRLLRVSLCEIE
mmetsp:Transcript_2078/g.5424  ORF Transcript_2078/g.5424 Transcript_2078/m.5424 type:complete len:142 (-) Transcript_2078:55-480(-)